MSCAQKSFFGPRERKVWTRRVGFFHWRDEDAMLRRIAGSGKEVIPALNGRPSPGRFLKLETTWNPPPQPSPHEV